MTDPRVGQTILAFAETLNSFAGRLKQIWGQPEPNSQSQPVGDINHAPPSDPRGTHMTTQDGVDLQPSVIPSPKVASVESHSTIQSSQQPRHATSTVEPPGGPPIICSPATPSMECSQDTQQSVNVVETTNVSPRTLLEEAGAQMTPQTTVTASSSSQRESMHLLPRPDTFCLPCLQHWKRRLETKEELLDCIHLNDRQTCTQCTKRRLATECTIKSTKVQTNTLKRLKTELENARKNGSDATTEAANLKKEVQKVIQLIEITRRSPSKTPKSKRPRVKEEPTQLSAKRQRITRPATPRPTPTSAPPSEPESDISMKSESMDDDNPGLSMVTQYENSGQ